MGSVYGFVHRYQTQRKRGADWRSPVPLFGLPLLVRPSDQHIPKLAGAGGLCLHFLVPGAGQVRKVRAFSAGSLTDDLPAFPACAILSELIAPNGQRFLFVVVGRQKRTGTGSRSRALRLSGTRSSIERRGAFGCLYSGLMGRGSAARFRYCRQCGRI